MISAANTNATSNSSSRNTRSNATEYLDWNDSLNILDKAYKLGLFVLIIGPKGTGKTALVRKFASQINKELVSINFSLRTRESHLIGTNTIDNGQINFVNGILVRSMTEGNILYLDELNAAEPDVLLRLDEALDDRRQIVLKESEGQTIIAKEGLVFDRHHKPIVACRNKRITPSDNQQISNQNNAGLPSRGNRVGNNKKTREL